MSAQIRDMTKGSPAKLILLFAVPLMLGNIFQQLYTMVDTVVVGQVAGVQALAALGAVEWIMWMVLGVSTGVTQGFSILISQHYGARKWNDLKKAVAHSYLLTAITAVSLLIVSQLAARWILLLLNTPDNIIGMSLIYLRIVFCGIPVVAAYNIFASVLRALGNSRTPLIAMIIAALINVILDLTFVAVLHWGVAGAALATVISQCVSAILVTWSLTRAYDAMKLKFRELRMDARVLKKELKIGVPGALQACAYGVTNVVIQASVNSFGTDTAAGWAAYGKLDLIFWTVSSALGAAVTTFAGQNYGAGKMDRVYKSIRVNVVISYIFTGAIIVILFVFCEPLYHMFTTDPKVIEIGVYMLRFLIPSYLLSVLLENLSGGLRGLGDVFWPTVFTFGGLFFVRLPWIMILTKIHHEVEVLLISYPLAWGGTLLCLIPYYFWRKKKRMKLAGR